MVPNRLFIAALAAFSLSAAPALAQDSPTALGIECADRDGVRFCEGAIDTRVTTFDGVPLDINVALPAGDSTDLPLAVLSHGYGGSKLGFDSMKGWAQRGYAVLTISARGFGDSCGSPESRLADPLACATGHVRLDDTRFEAHDVQHLAGLLTDEGIVDGQRVGVTGGSYGGGVSLALSALKDRVMNEDGTLSPWTSPGGEPMRIAGAAPWIPWSDLAYALAPNGRHLDYTVSGDEQSSAPAGVAKASYVAGLFATGNAAGFYSLPGTDPDADLTTWFARVNAGEPYDGDPVIADIFDELTTHHSAYKIDHSQAPAPTFLASGWTDDLFPAHETLRFYNRTRAEHPETPLALMYLDFGHARGQNKTADVARFHAHVDAWFDRYVKGDETVTPINGVEALTQTCPKDAPSGGPYAATNWSALHPGEVRFADEGTQTVLSLGGDPLTGRLVDPIAGGGACVQVAGGDEDGTASWTLPAATGDGYTLLGSPTVIADLSVTGVHAQVAARLWDVAEDGTQTLVSRGVYRPEGSGRQAFQLHANGWHFAAGHAAKLQLLGRDAPFARPSNGVFSIDVSALDLRLPVRDTPDCETVTTPAAPFVPEGATLAPDVDADGVECVVPAGEETGGEEPAGGETGGEGTGETPTTGTGDGRGNAAPPTTQGGTATQQPAAPATTRPTSVPAATVPVKRAKRLPRMTLTLRCTRSGAIRAYVRGASVQSVTFHLGSRRVRSTSAARAATLRSATGRSVRALVRFADGRTLRLTATRSRCR